MKSRKKLTLHRETLYLLADARLDPLQGGTGNTNHCSNCQTCGTCDACQTFEIASGCAFNCGC